MEPVSMMAAAGAVASVALPVAGKAAEMGMDLVKGLMESATDGGGQLGADQQPPAPPQVEF